MKTKAAVAIVLTLILLLALSMFPQDNDFLKGGFDYQPSSGDKVLALGSEERLEYTRMEAGKTAERIFGDDSHKRQAFEEQLLAADSKLRDYDFVLFYNPGGWGKKPLSEVSDEWDTVVQGIDDWLKDAGYATALIEYTRCDNTVPDIIGELKSFMTARYSRADELAAQIHFLTSVEPKLRVILLGESSGAMFSTDVMKLLKSNPRVFSILAGQPFWDKDPLQPRTLIVNYNGIESDALVHGDLWAMFRHNFVRLASLFRPGNFVKLDENINAPGHRYSWNYPIVRQQITDFLEANFSAGGPQA